MRDIHRLKERFELSLDNGQVLLLALGAFAVVATAFGLGVAVGEKLAAARPIEGFRDPLAIADQQTAGLERVQKPQALTFQEELTRKAPASPPSQPVAGSSPAPRPGEAARRAEPGSSTQAAAPVDVAARAPTAETPAATPQLHGSSQGGEPPSTTVAAAAPPAVAPIAAPVGATGGATAAALSPPAAHVEAPPTAVAAPPSAPIAAPPAPGPVASARGSARPDRAAAEVAAAPGEPARSTGSLREAFLRAQRAPSGAPGASGAPASSAWTVQVSASQDRGEAERMAAELRAKGYAPYIVSAEVPGKGVWHRVRMGRFGSKEAAGRYLVDFRRETQLGAFVASAGAP